MWDEGPPPGQELVVSGWEPGGRSRSQPGTRLAGWTGESRGTSSSTHLLIFSPHGAISFLPRRGSLRMPLCADLGRTLVGGSPGGDAQAGH